MKMFKKLSVAVLALALSISFAACGSSGYKSDSAGPSFSTNGAASESYYDKDYGYEYSEEEYTPESGAAEQPDKKVEDTSRKLIKTYNMSVETESFDGFVDMIQAKVNQLGGYIENMNVSNGSKYYGSYKENRYSYLTIRIPVKNTDDFLNLIGENANITDKSLSVEDVTLNYVDLESRKKAYITEQDRLLELLEKAETIEEILTIEDRLTNIRYNLESMEAQLRSYDNKIDYTTIYLSISEVKEYTEPEPESFGQRIVKSFTNGFDNTVRGFKNFIIGFAGALPGLVVFAIVCAIITFAVMGIVKLCTKKSAKKKAAAVSQPPVYADVPQNRNEAAHQPSTTSEQENKQ